MYKYYLAFSSTQIFLFESQFQFLNEDRCLRHYEKGLAKGLFGFEGSRINQVWSELALWGLIGRICPVELVRVLCAFGCRLKMVGPRASAHLSKSFFPVTYFIPVVPGEKDRIWHLYNRLLDPNSAECIPILLELDDRLVIGSYYTTSKRDIDVQMPKFCELMEQDMCLQACTLRDVLFDFLRGGYKITAQDHGQCIVLAKWNAATDTLRGYANDDTLFYVGSSSKKREAG